MLTPVERQMTADGFLDHGPSGRTVHQDTVFGDVSRLRRVGNHRLGQRP